MYRIYTIFCFTLSLFVNAQTLSKKELRNSEWFSDNKDSVFFKSDTIKLINYKNKSQKQIKDLNVESAVDEYKYFGHSIFVSLYFKKNMNLAFTEQYWHLAASYPNGLFTWNFDKKNIIYIYKSNKLNYKLKIIGNREIEIKLNNSELIKTMELTVVKIK